MTDETPEVVTKTEARQGIAPGVTRNVLALSLGGAIGVLVLAYLAFFAF
jgi:hypothetical protein